MDDNRLSSPPALTDFATDLGFWSYDDAHLVTIRDTLKDHPEPSCAAVSKAADHVLETRKTVRRAFA